MYVESTENGIGSHVTTSLLTRKRQKTRIPKLEQGRRKLSEMRAFDDEEGIESDVEEDNESMAWCD